MNAASNLTTTRTSDSSDRNVIAIRTGHPAGQPKPATSRLSGAAKRLLNALMRSLATPHI